ncbi:MAG: metal-dependent transcriptional regulator [Oscillospiraceae bacterium]|nr:metal-dependent transcriptional regulator [Oscillospiraceae bacterium]
MALHESAEMYLETIYSLSQQQSSVRSIDVAESMGYSKPSVSRAVGLLKQGGYLLMDKDGFLTLTESGVAVAQKIFERHNVLSRMLIALGVSQKAAAEDACKIEHVISDETFEAIKSHMMEYL